MKKTDGLLALISLIHKVQARAMMNDETLQSPISFALPRPRPTGWIGIILTDRRRPVVVVVSVHSGPLSPTPIVLSILPGAPGYTNIRIRCSHRNTYFNWITANSALTHAAPVMPRLRGTVGVPSSCGEAMLEMTGVLSSSSSSDVRPSPLADLDNLQFMAYK